MSFDLTLSDFAAVEEPNHDRDGIAKAFGVDVSSVAIEDNDGIRNSVTFTAPVAQIEGRGRFIANRIAEIGYDVIRSGENADRKWFVTVKAVEEVDRK